MCSILEEGLRLKDDDLHVIQIIETILGERFWTHGMILFTHGDEYEKKMKAQDENMVILDFEQQVKRDLFSMDKYALGPKIRKANFCICKIENRKKKKEEREEMVSDILEKIDAIIERNQNSLYDENCLPDEVFVPPRQPAQLRQNQQRQEESSCTIF